MAKLPKTEHAFRLRLIHLGHKMERLADEFREASQRPSSASYQAAMRQSELEVQTLLQDVYRAQE